MCTSPNYMIWQGDYTKNDRPLLKFVGHHQYKRLQQSSLEFDKFPFIQVPCGKCLECRIQYTRSWSDRCVLEAKQYKHNYFVTLTYDDDHLPAGNSLDPKEMQSFMNRLRKHFKRKLKFEGKIRFLLAGEYGSTSWRPHYHLLLFNCPLTDLSYEFYMEVDGKLVRHDRPPSKNNDLFFSKTIYDLWTDKNGSHKGMISVGMFNYDTASYVAQYVTKKCLPGFDKGDIYKELGLYPEFIRMSNRPGIGWQYYEDHPFIHDEGRLIVPGDGEAHKTAVPRYFDKLFVKKYGQDIFDTEIAARRSQKRFNNHDTYTFAKRDIDRENDLRDTKLQQLYHLKQCI